MFGRDQRKGVVEGPTKTTPTSNGQVRRTSGDGNTPQSAEGARKSTNNTLDNIQQLERKRQQRRVAAAEQRADKAAEEKRNAAAGLTGDVDFMRAIRAFREEASTPGSAEGAREHVPPGDMKVNICVRKRPINRKELRKNDHDSVTCLNPKVIVHDCKLRVDGITKYLDNQQFEFDHSFGENSSTDEVYFYVAQPLVSYVCRGGRATCFAYGQTGSGKTYTMVGIQNLVVKDLFDELDKTSDYNDMEIFVSFFEIYGGRCQDLLNKRHRLNVREDGKGEVHVAGLEEFCVNSAADLLSLVARGNQLRTTQATETNDTSSRSHAICQIALRRAGSGRLHGKLSLVDLAGSERGQDTKSHNRQLRTESAEINKSLLALKECIRGIASNSSHVPFRAAKLTMVLRDSFVRPNSRVAMIATVSPAVSATDHTINTLRYADRVKEKPIRAAAAVAPVGTSMGLGDEEPNNFQPKAVVNGLNGRPRRINGSGASVAEERAAQRRVGSGGQGRGGRPNSSGGVVNTSSSNAVVVANAAGRETKESQNDPYQQHEHQRQWRQQQQEEEEPQRALGDNYEDMTVEEFGDEYGEEFDELTVDGPLPVAEPRETASQQALQNNGMRGADGGSGGYISEEGTQKHQEKEESSPAVTPDQDGNGKGAQSKEIDNGGRSASLNNKHRENPSSGGSQHSSQASVSANEWERQPPPKRNLFNQLPSRRLAPAEMKGSDAKNGDLRSRRHLRSERRPSSDQLGRQPSWSRAVSRECAIPPWPRGERTIPTNGNGSGRTERNRTGSARQSSEHEAIRQQGGHHARGDPISNPINTRELSTRINFGSGSSSHHQEANHTSDKENHDFVRGQRENDGTRHEVEAAGAEALHGEMQQQRSSSSSGDMSPNGAMEANELDGTHETDMAYVQRQNLVGEGGAEVAEFHKTVESLFEEEEALLNLHMNVIQENAELLTEEGRLLQNIQGDEVVDYDIDAYAARLEQILDRKAELIVTLKEKLQTFRNQLQAEENASQRVQQMPQY